MFFIKKSINTDTKRAGFFIYVYMFVLSSVLNEENQNNKQQVAKLFMSPKNITENY